MNPAKRRRLDATASTLRKPFRSPLKVPTADPASPKPTVASNLDQQRPSPSPSAVTVHISPTKPSRQLSSPDGSKSESSPSQPIDEVIVFQKQYSALAQELRRLRQDLDVVEQARKLRVGDQTQQLEHISSKWRDIARSAADEVFDIMSSRVKDMGGLQAWQKNTQESSQSWLDHSNSSADDAHPHKDDHEQDQYPDTTRLGHIERDEEIDDQQEQCFTMTTMLGQMNIDPSLLGFDENNNQWAD